jgi:hypothetical protein
MQKLALQASGANAVSLGGLPGMLPGFPGFAGLMPGMGNGLSPSFETPTKVVVLTQVSPQLQALHTAFCIRIALSPA